MATTTEQLDDFSLQLLNKDGFTTPERRAFRSAVLERIHKDGNLWARLWPLTDAYGKVGLVPAQGYDWSGFRDSTFTALAAMARKLRMKVPQ